jgi:hypothetical protein
MLSIIMLSVVMLSVVALKIQNFCMSGILAFWREKLACNARSCRDIGISLEMPHNASKCLRTGSFGTSFQKSVNLIKFELNLKEIYPMRHF